MANFFAGTKRVGCESLLVIVKGKAESRILMLYISPLILSRSLHVCVKNTVDNYDSVNGH